MQRIQEVPDNVFNEVKDIMTNENNGKEPSFDAIFDTALEVLERKRDCGFRRTIDAYNDIMY